MEYVYNGQVFVCRQWLSGREELSLAERCPADHWCQFQSFFYVRSNRAIVEAHCGLEADQIGPDAFENAVLATSVNCYGVDSKGALAALEHWVRHGRLTVLGELRRHLHAKKFGDWMKDYYLDASRPTEQLAYRIHFDLTVRDKQVSPEESAWDSVLERTPRFAAPTRRPRVPV